MKTIELLKKLSENPVFCLNIKTVRAEMSPVLTSLLEESEGEFLEVKHSFFEKYFKVSLSEFEDQIELNAYMPTIIDGNICRSEDERFEVVAETFDLAVQKLFEEVDRLSQRKVRDVLFSKGIMNFCDQ